MRHESEVSNPSPLRQVEHRSIDHILARRRHRLRQRKQVFPPDFCHGEARIDEVYATFGPTWVEQAVFVEAFYDDHGALAAWTVARFDGRFLTIEQAIHDEVDDLAGRLAEQLDGAGSVVELGIGDVQLVDPTNHLTVCCSLGRLLELERTCLAVVRDKEVSDRRAIYSQRDAVLQDSRTSILSLICLCARLADR